MGGDQAQSVNVTGERSSDGDSTHCGTMGVSTFTQRDPLNCLKTCPEKDPDDGGLIRAALNDIARAQNFRALGMRLHISTAQ